MSVYLKNAQDTRNCERTIIACAVYTNGPPWLKWIHVIAEWLERIPPGFKYSRCNARVVCARFLVVAVSLSKNKPRYCITLVSVTPVLFAECIFVGITLKRIGEWHSKNNDGTFPITYICPIYLRLLTLQVLFLREENLQLY